MQLTSVLCCVLGLLAAVSAVEETAQGKMERRFIVLKNTLRVAEGQTSGVALPKAVADALKVHSEDLYRTDQQNNAASENTHWKVDTRSKNGKLFTKVDQTVFQKPTYKALIALLDNYQPVLGIAETTTAQEKQEESAFLDAILATSVMQKAHDFLKSQGLVPASKPEFKALLQKIWFTLYRRRGQPDTSGFEHVFVGEYKGDSPTENAEGFHNWVQLATQEAAGKTNYKFWKGQAEPDLYGMQFSWNGHLKIKSTIAIGESPEMSIAVNTVCFFVAPNDECKLKMGGADVSVLTYRWDTRDPKEFYVASAYYN